MLKDHSLSTKFGYKLSYNLRLQLSLKQINIATYFENLTVELHVLYILKTHVKFHANRILFTIRSKNLLYIYIYNFRLQQLEI